MKIPILFSLMAAVGLLSAAPVIPSAGVRAELKTGSSPLFESIGTDANTLPLDWPAAATKAKVELVRNGITNEVELADTTATTLTIAIPASIAKEERVEVTVAYCDANDIARRTDRAVVYVVTGMNGSSCRFNSAPTNSVAWGKHKAKQPVVQTLAADDTVTRNGVAVAGDGSFYRSFPKVATGDSVAAGLTASDAGYSYSVNIIRTGDGIVLSFK